MQMIFAIHRFLTAIAVLSSWQWSMLSTGFSLCPRVLCSAPLSLHHYRQQEFATALLSLVVDEYTDDAGTKPLATRIHHSAFKTRNITTAIQFYSLLGFEVQYKFRAGPARAAWLRLGSLSPSLLSSCLEIIEVPGYMLQEAPGTKKRAIDLNLSPELLGWNHLALDVTDQVVQTTNGTLSAYMQRLNVTSVERFGKTLRVAVNPKQVMIGNQVYELAFLYDADGCLVELLHKQGELEQDIESGWEPWDDGKGFLGGLPTMAAKV